jgi:ubiquinone/menaquinone biosynthesis methyltransferase
MQSDTPYGPAPAGSARSQPVAELAARERPEAEGHGAAVRDMFDRISPTYDLLNRLLSFRIDQRWRERALRVLADAAPDGPLLDSCAGTLDLTAGIARRWPGRSLVAGDFSREMLVRGRAKLAAPSLVACDAMRLPFASGRFAGVTCGFGMRNLADPARGAAEALRVLRPSGVFVVLEFFKPTRVPTRIFHALYGQVVLPLLGRLVSGDAEAYSYLSRSMRGFLTRDEFERLLRDAGFREVHAADLTFGVASLVWGIK